MADIEQLKKIVPLITCEVSFCQNVCELVFGVNVTDLDFGGPNPEQLWVRETCLIAGLRPFIII